MVVVVASHQHHGGRHTGGTVHADAIDGWHESFDFLDQRAVRIDKGFVQHDGGGAPRQRQVVWSASAVRVVHPQAHARTQLVVPFRENALVGLQDKGGSTGRGDDRFVGVWWC